MAPLNRGVREVFNNLSLHTPIAIVVQRSLLPLTWLGGRPTSVLQDASSGFINSKIQQPFVFFFRDLIPTGINQSGSRRAQPGLSELSRITFLLRFRLKQKRQDEHRRAAERCAPRGGSSARIRFILDILVVSAVSHPWPTLGGIFQVLDGQGGVEGSTTAFI